jgi:nucleoside-diphosphate-sugar epimerase
MAKKVVVIGGTGQIGREIVETFLEAGWQVTAVQRGTATCLPPHPAVTTISADRNEPGALDGAVGSGADALIDIVAVTAEHARQLIGLQSRVDAFAVVSSASVYCDEKGRTIAEAGFSELPVPVPETQRTIAPGADCYSARKAALEQMLLQNMKVPLTIVRPAAVHGPGSRAPREWWFLKRLMDGRKTIPLAFEGRSLFHTTATANLAELIRVALERRGTRILNAADPTALSSREIGKAIAAAAGYDLQIATLPGPPTNGVGASPWSLRYPLLLDMSAAESLGYRAVTTYVDFAKPTCAWLSEATRKRAWQDAFPELKPLASAWFNYDQEDVVLQSR